jgi:CxxC motif-containing protein
MIKKLTCVECPKGCAISIDIENCKVVKVTGAKCPRGVAYALSETQNPVRILTATVIADGLDLKLVPVRTNKPIPKKDIFRAVEELGKTRVTKPVKAGEVIAENFLGLGVKLLATREVMRKGGK